MSEETLPAAQVLLVEDEPDHAEVMAETLKRLGHVCTVVHNLPDALAELDGGSFDLVVTDLKMTGETDGMDVLAAAKKMQQGTEVVMVTAHGDVPTAKAAIKGGAYEFIEKPLDLDVFRTLCTRAIEARFLKADNKTLRKRLDQAYSFEGILGQSQAIAQVINQLKMVAPSEIPVLVTGPSGTGKELVAAALHNQSSRAMGRFVPLNCAGLSESILEDELFGHVKGAFTGADTDREGRFEYAHRGTLFLDEVGDMPMPMQAKLLRVLESGEVVRVGDNAPRNVNVRVVSATNRDLMQMVKAGTFREDLYYRLAGVQIQLPPLNERTEDVPILAQHFLVMFAEKMHRDAPAIASDAVAALQGYDWPGNIRQLRNIMQNALMQSGGEQIETQHLPPDIQACATAPTDGGMNLQAMEKMAIVQALQQNGGDHTKAATALGLSPEALAAKLEEHQLS